MMGPRPDESSSCVRKVLEQLRRRIPQGTVVLRTDMKPSYAVIARSLFGERLVHQRTAGTDRRTTHNPLFPINTTLAMTRDNCGRLRRKSWLVSKKKECLQSQMELFIVYRNYVRRRFNRDQAEQTPAWYLGLMPRQLFPDEVLAWRQDWGEFSISPLSHTGGRRVA